MSVTPKKEPQAPVRPTAEAGEALAAQFSRNLLTYPEALHYVESRGIARTWAEAGEIGFCPPYAENIFPLLKGRIVVPIRDVHGSVIAFAGRQFEPMRQMTERAIWEMFSAKPARAQETIDKWNRGKWINETFPKKMHLFGLHDAKNFARERGYIVIVEGYLDRMVLASKTLGNTAAVCGTTLSSWHAALIKRYCDHVVLLLDGDTAGEKALETILPRLEESDLVPHIVFLPQGYDPDDFALKFGGKQLRRVIEGMLERNEAEIRINIT